MATKIKRCLYVGLGGTGMNALLHTKKMFVETYGEVPPMIGFLGIDTDGGVYKKELPSKFGPITISPNEQMPIKVENARDAYMTSKEHFGWVPEQNVFALTSMTKGAGQIRTNGRFALTCNFEALTNKVKDVVNRICAAQIMNNQTYDINIGAEVEVHMVFSMSGGTGAGTFLNMAYIIKNALNKCKLTGYAVLPDVFENMSNYGMERVKPNAYGSICDLDWFMHLNGTEKLQFDYVTSKQQIVGAPFNAIFFIDNRNENGDTYSNIEQLAEMISLALVTSAGELADSVTSVTDNVEKSIMNGDGMVGNKRAWVSGMGACEVIFRGKDMSDICALKNAQRIIQRMMNSCVDANTIANAWIDSPEVNIRENGGAENDNVIDFILSKQPKFPLDAINDNQNAKAEALGYIENVGMPKSDDVQMKVQELKERVIKELHSLIVKSVNQECGVGLAKDVLEAIKSQVEVFLKEMNSEKDTIAQRQPALENAISVTSEDLKEYSSRFFKTKSKVNDLEQSVCDAAIALAINKREVARRDAAITFFNSLIVAISDEQLKIVDIEKKLKAVNTSYVNRIAALTNSVDRTTDATFQIDLAKQAVNTIGINDDEIQIKDFLSTLPYNEKFYEIDAKMTDEVENVILSYTMSLPTAKKWEKTTIDDIMKKMDKEDPGKLDLILRLALAKAMPLLNINTRGQVGYMYGRFSYVGVPMTSTLLQDNGRLEQLAGGEKIQFARLGMQDRVIIYNQIGVVPAYFIGSLQNYKQKYDKCSVFSHIDATIHQRMIRENFSLEPVLDDGSKDVELWVKGLIMGLIKNENGQYYVKDKTNGKALRQYWIELGQYRDEAFATFKADLPNLRQQFKEYFKQYQSANGMDAMQTIVNDAKHNYLDKYSQVQMTIDQIEDRGNEQIADLLEKELSYVETL